MATLNSLLTNTPTVSTRVIRTCTLQDNHITSIYIPQLGNNGPHHLLHFVVPSTVAGILSSTSPGPQLHDNTRSS